MISKMPDRRTTLIEATSDLITAFASGASLTALVSKFTVTPPAQAREHGHPKIASFIGQTFIGHKGVGQYFNLVERQMRIKEIKFEDEKDWVVDTGNSVVFLRGKAKWQNKLSEEEWEEIFAYRIALAEEEWDGSKEKGQTKVQFYEVWADTAAAFLAEKGSLRHLETAYWGSGMS
ncbi:hypothetical protein BJX70DRAFT_44351 [Aspergillus crustosus]